MGLDMYLMKRHYVRNWDFTKPEERYQITITHGDKPVPKTEIDPDKIEYLIEEAGYWRKANAIHRWFVEHVQDGEDDCKVYDVQRDHLLKLLDTVNKVLAASKLVKGKVQNGSILEGSKLVPILEDGKRIRDPTVARMLLPTQEGCFFGGTDYDQYYIEDLKRTRHILEAALVGTAGSYCYQSSW